MEESNNSTRYFYIRNSEISADLHLVVPNVDPHPRTDHIYYDLFRNLYRTNPNLSESIRKKIQLADGTNRLRMLYLYIPSQKFNIRSEFQYFAI